MADDYDSPWKEAIERCFAEFLAFYFPEVHAQIDGMLRLPKERELQFRKTIVNIEQGKTMRYLSSIERFAMKEGMEKGIQQGMQQGVKQGQARALARMLAYRFGGLPDWVQQKTDERNGFNA